MNRTVRKYGTRLSAASLAVAVAFGGFGVLPAAHAEETQNVQQAVPASFAYLGDPARSKLIDLNALRVISTYPAQSSAFMTSEYYKMLELEQEAYAAVMDPSTSQAHLQAIARTYKLRLDDYMDRYLDRFWVEDYLYTVQLSIRAGIGDDSELSAEDRHTLDVIDRTFAQARSAKNPTDKNYRDAYVEIYAQDVLKDYTVEAPSTPGQYRAMVSYAREKLERNLQAARAAGSTEDYSAQLQAFEQAASDVEQLLNASASVKLVEMVTGYAQFKAQEAIESFDPYVPVRPYGEEKELRSMIESAKARLDLPRGIQPGQYPASAFGALSRAIKEAELALEKGDSRADFAAALDKLFLADYAFRNSIKR
ncbi:hypothetical protein [Saccharibacillus alkalitolerans]|uniref:DUF3829 domain-containing protein n=1 Tax=Saccharibacillus alkalitolerans TaxID=2705290 RepID=A0ABX0EZE0_9BACL|nr:hypothetical protein [Saccharibacillus alkalitolerans]NGZ74108.1 hypothetical protein [Saccharibacillus alkalitolerans]